MATDLEILYSEIVGKREAYTALKGYYAGKQPTVYLTKRMRELFRPLDISFTENWCAVVIDACDERISLNGFQTTNTQAQTVLDEAWGANELGNESADIHTDSQIIGESFAIVWPGVDGKAEVFYNDARMVGVVYHGDNPRKIRVAGKLWTGDDGLAKFTAYYADRIEYYTSTQPAADVSSPASFIVDPEFPTITNIYNQIPVFHFRLNRAASSDLINVLPLQNGVNKLLSDMMVAAEFGAFQQRWIISQGDTSGIKNAPGEVLDIPAGDGIMQDTSVGSFASTDLDNYLKAISSIALTIGTITRTPKHYFFGQGGDPSGEALIAMEAPLNKKAQDRIDRFVPIWQKVAALICQISGVAVKASDVTPDFEKPETVQPKTSADIIKVSVDSGIPLETAVTRAGWSKPEIDAMLKLKEEDDKAKEESLANSLMKAQQSMKTAPMPGEEPRAKKSNTELGE